MAKKKEFKLDDYGFDSGMDIPDFDLELPEIKDDRKPVTKLKDGFIDGVKSSVASPAFIRSMVKESLPRGYGSAIDLADDSLNTITGLYNDAAKEIKPVIKDLKRVTKRLLPVTEPILPSKIANKIREWAQDEQKNFSIAQEQQRDLTIQSTLSDIFQLQETQRMKDKSESDAKEQLQDSIAQTRHVDQMGQLDAMRVSLQQLAGYQDRVGSAFQRKSLELQFRHYFSSVDLLEETRKFNATTTASLEAISKNTGLPDYVKITQSESMKQIMRNKFMDSLYDGVFGNRRNFVKNLGSRLSGIVKDKARGFAGDLQAGLMQGDEVADMYELTQSMKEMGMEGPSKEEMLGSVAGSIATDTLGKKVGKWIRGKVGQNEKVNRLGNKLTYTTGNVPQILTEWAHSDKGNNIPIIGGIVEELKNSIHSMNAEDTSFITDKAGSMQEPDVFRKMTNKSINDVIPGYLARIHQEIKILRTGDETVPLLQYDYMTNKFSDQRAIAKSIFGRLFNKDEQSDNQKQIEALIDKIDPNKTLSTEQRKSLGQKLLHDNLSNRLGSKERLSNADTYYETGHGKYAEEFAQLFEEYFKNDDSHSRQIAFSQDYNQLGSRLSDRRKQIQDYINLGYYDQLADMGLVDGDNLNKNQYRKYAFGDDDFSPQDPRARFKLKVKRGQQSRETGSMGRPTFDYVGERQTPETVAPSSVTINATEIIAAIKEGSSKSVAETINETLLRIEKQIASIEEKTATGFGGVGEEGKKRWFNKTLGDIGSDAGRFAKYGFGKMMELKNRAADKVGSLYQGAKGAITGSFSWLRNKATELGDIYVKGELFPRITLAKLKAGEYFDALSGKVITDYKEIRGAIKDAAGNIVMTADEAKEAFMKNNYVQKALKSISKGLSATWGFAKSLPGHYATAAGWLWSGAKKVGSGITDFLNRPKDVYVKNKPDPVLLAVTMKAGGYRSKITGKVISRLNDIDGPVLDMDGNVVLTTEELAGGLFDKNGKPIRTGYRGLLSKAGDILQVGWKGLKSAGRLFADKSKAAFDYLGGLFKDGKFPGISGSLDIFNNNTLFGSRSSNTTNLLLYQIRNMLNDRLPGDRSSFDDSELELKKQSMARALLNKAKGWAKGIKDKFGRIISDDESEEGGIKGRIKKKFGNLKEKLGFAKDKAKDKVASSIESLPNLLKQIRDRLSPQKKHIVGDSDGDGVRDGSYYDLMRKKGFLATSAKDKEKDAQKQSDNKSGLLSTLGGLAGLLGGKKKKDDDDSSLTDMAEGAAAGGIMSKGWKYAKSGGSKLLGWGKNALGLIGLGGGAATAATGAEALAATAAAAEGVAGTAAAAEGAAAVAGGGGLLSGIGTALAGAASAIGSVISAPVVIGGLVLAGLAYGGYKLYKRKRLKMFNKLRYVQYGFSPSDSDHLQEVLGLEDLLKDGVYYRRGIAAIDDKKIDIKKMIDSFGIDLKDTARVNNWLLWFSKRFKPVYLTHLSILQSVSPKTDLSDVEDLPSDLKQKLLDGVKWPDGPYDIRVSPFSDLDSLTTGGSDVAGVVSEIQDAITKDSKGSSKPGAVKAKTAAEAALATTPTESPSKPTNLAPASQTTDNAQSSPRTDITGISQPTNTTTIDGPVIADAKGRSRVDALSCVMYKAIGLVQLELDRVKNIDALIDEVDKGVVFKKKNQASWEGSVDDMLKNVGPVFGVHGVNNAQAYNWVSWFRYRFIPVYLGFRSALAAFTNKKDVDSAMIVLKPQQALDIAMQLASTRSAANGGMSVWKMDQSPWKDYALNTDPKSVDGNIAGLKEKAQSVALDETFARIDAGQTSEDKLSGAEQARADAEAQQKEPDTIWGKVKQSTSNVFTGITEKVSNKARDVYDAARGGFNRMLGREIQHDGKGTGGDINALPNVTGAGFDKVKDLLLAVAKMVGVDPQLLISMAGIESNFNPSAKASTSSATGLFQFVTDTWRGMLRKYAGKYGINTSVEATDARANALMGAEYIRENIDYLKGKIGRGVTDVDVYMAHFLGAGGASKFLTTSPDTIGAQAFPKEASANKPIFYTNDGKPRTIGEIYQLFKDRLNKKAQQTGFSSGSGSASTASAPAPGSEAYTSGKPATPAASTTPASAPSTPTPSIPVVNQTTAPATSAPTPKPAVKADTPSTDNRGSPIVDPAKLAVNPNFGVTAMRSLTEQTAARGRESMMSLDGVNDTLGKSLTVQTDSLAVLRQIYEIIQKNAGNTGRGNIGGSAKVSQNESSDSIQVSAAKRPTEMSAPPVDMSKSSYA